MATCAVCASKSAQLKTSHHHWRAVRTAAPASHARRRPQCRSAGGLGAAQAATAVPTLLPASDAHDTINGSVVTASKLFDQNLLSLPMVQRPYDWTEDNALELVDDLLDCLPQDQGTDVPIGELEQYMLGLITLAQTAGSAGDPHARKQIIDGQQRIITLALVLAATRERLLLAAKGGDSGAARLARSLEERLYEAGDPGDDLPEQPRILLKSKADTDLLTNLLTDESFVAQPDTTVVLEGGSQPKLWANMQAIRKRMAEIDDACCMLLAKYILQKVVFIVTVSSSIHLALKVFKTSAQRGKDLMAVDLLKACVFQAIRPEKEVAYGDKWEEWEKTLGRGPGEGLSDVAKQLVVAFLGRWTTVNSEFDDFEALFKAFAAEHGACTGDAAGASAAGEAFMDELWVPCCQAYQELQDADFRRAQAGPGQERAARDVCYLLRVLGRLAKKQDEWRAAALAMLLLHRRRRLSDDALRACLAEAERLVTCSVLCKWTPRARKERWVQVLTELGCCSGSTYAVLSTRGAAAAGAFGAAAAGPMPRPPALQLGPNEEAAMLAALDGPVYDSYTRDVPRALLMRLNEFMLSRNGADYVSYEEKPRSQLSVEHVLPQKVDPASPWASLFTEDERAAWVHRLANLVLLSGKRNTAAGTLPFARKKERYVSSGTAAAGFTNIPLTDGMLQQEDWTPAVLEQRQRYVLALARNCWQLHDRPPP